MFKNKNHGNNNLCGKRFVTDIELKAFAKIFEVTAEELL